MTSNTEKENLVGGNAGISGILKELASVFNEEWYAKTYKDIENPYTSGLEHYLNKGWSRGFFPNSVFDQRWYMQNYMHANAIKTNPLQHYFEIGRHKKFKFNPIADHDFLVEEYQIPNGIDPMYFMLENDIDKISTWFSRKHYLRINPDVINYWGSPELHFSHHGIKEGRKIGVGYKAINLSEHKDRTYRSTDRHEKIVAEFTIGETRYGIRHNKICDDIVDQIYEQATIEPDIIACGFKSLPFIEQFNGTDIDRRNCIVYRRILSDIPIGLDAVIVIPALRMGGAEKYAANLIDGLHRIGLKNTLLLTTDDSISEDNAALNLTMFKVLAGTRIFSIRESLKLNWIPENILALALLRSRAKHIFVVNSDIGLRMIKTYGKPLSNVSNLYVTFFSESPNVVGSPYSARYLKDVQFYARILSDNATAIEKWLARTTHALSKRFFCLPSHINQPTSCEFANRIHARSLAHSTSNNTALWFSRWEPFKCPEVLSGLAQMNPDLQIECYGTVDDTYIKEKLPPNLLHHGVCNDIGSINLDKYFVFIFTSMFEGMPNVVLEMAMLGLPIVASDVGGLRECFDDSMVDFIDMTRSPEEVLSDFNSSVEKVKRRCWEETKERLLLARAAVEKRHSTEVFLSKLSTLIGETK
jgi:glycosyltransferase involved in cell wall biosynthesis